MLLLKQLKLS